MGFFKTMLHPTQAEIDAVPPPPAPPSEEPKGDSDWSEWKLTLEPHTYHAGNWNGTLNHPRLSQSKRLTDRAKPAILRWAKETKQEFDAMWAESDRQAAALQEHLKQEKEVLYL